MIANTDVNVIAICMQCVQSLLVALIMALMTRTVPQRFLNYWTLAWAFQAMALAMQVNSFAATATERFFQTLFCFGQYIFGMLVWTGCGDATRGVPLRRRDMPFLAATAIVAVALPILAGGMAPLLALHSLILAGIFIAGVVALRPWRVQTQRSIGLMTTTAALVLLTVQSIHYSVVYTRIARRGSPTSTAFLRHSPVYDGLSESLLAFGMLLLASEKMRRELEEKNLRLAEATEQLRQMARIDQLTGLLNRHAYESVLTSPPVGPFEGAVVVVDLDNMKPLNDRYGHATGDAALQAIARALLLRTRSSDMVFRWGGDEFLLLMLGSNAADASSRMREVENALLGARLLGVEERTDLPISWGLAEFRDAASLPDAVSKADSAMYAVKARRKMLVRG